MAIKEPDIYKIVERIGDHYKNNISNRFMRKALLSLELPQAEWDRLDGLTSKSDYYKAQGFTFDDLYEMIIAAAHFIFQARQKILPNIKSMVSASSVLSKSGGVSEQDKVLRDMAAKNFPVNLQILTDMINELYMKTVAMDKQAHEKKTPIYERIPELKELGRYLVTQ